MPHGQTLRESVGLADCLEAVRRESDWDHKRAHYAGQSSTEKRRGIGVSALFLYCYSVLIRLAERWQWVRSFLGPGTPLLFFAGIGLMIPYFIWLDTSVYGADTGEQAARVALAYLSSWSSTLLFNPLAVPLPQCYGWGWDEWWVASIEWFRYPVLLAQQLVMVAIGLHFARRAVGLRRCRRV